MLVKNVLGLKLLFPFDLISLFKNLLEITIVLFEDGIFCRKVKRFTQVVPSNQKMELVTMTHA